MKLRYLGPNAYIHVFVHYLYSIFPRSVCLFCCRKIGGPIVGIYKSLTETWILKVGTVAALYLFWEYRNRIFFAMYCTREVFMTNFLTDISYPWSSPLSLLYSLPKQPYHHTLLIRPHPEPDNSLVELFFRGHDFASTVYSIFLTRV
jgi:hypothetical protein